MTDAILKKYYFAKECWRRRNKVAPRGKTWAEVFKRNYGISLLEYRESDERKEAERLINRPKEARR